MAFVGGYPDTDSIKLPLYAVEPEQISDIVVVPSDTSYYKVFPAYKFGIPQTASDRAISAVNFPSTTEFGLFQRYNPVGLPFADQYSTKLYNWAKKYSQLATIPFCSLLRVNYDHTRLTNKYVQFDIGSELKIKLPDNQQKISFSYYYPELNPEGLDFVDGQGGRKTVLPKDYQNWRTIALDNGRPITNRQDIYQFQRIRNNCISCPVGRAWVLRFETHYCNGQTISIDDDILISSLVFDFKNLNRNEIDSIKAQIPECYFYEYLDTYFSRLDAAIVENIGQPIGYELATRIDYELKYFYSIDHNIKTVYRVLYPMHNLYNYVFTEPSPNNRFYINGGLSGYVTQQKGEWVSTTINYQFGGIVYANNNYWNNYNFNYNLSDQGLIELYIVDRSSEPSRKLIIFECKGDYEIRDNYAGWTYPKNIFGEVTSDGGYPNNSFAFNNGIEQKGAVAPDYLSGTTNFNRIDRSTMENYFTKLFFDSSEGAPACAVTLENYVENVLWTVSNPIYHATKNNRIPSRLLRRTSTKVFMLTLNEGYFKYNYTDNISNTWSPSKVGDYRSQEYKIGELDCSYKNYSKTYPPLIEDYYIGDTKAQRSHVIFEGDPSGLNYSSPVTVRTKNGVFPLYSHIIMMYRDRPPYLQVVIELDAYTQPECQVYKNSGIHTFNLQATLVPGSITKSLRKIGGYEGLVNIIKTAHEVCYMPLIDLEELKKQVKEIHLTLEASKYAYDDTNKDTSRVANLGYYVERIARVLGISVNSNGSIRSIRQAKRIKEGQVIPSGWNIAQWGRNNGGSSSGQPGGDGKHEKDGLALEIKSNNFTNDDFTGETNKIEQGGYALVENIPQMLHLLMADLDRALGLQDAGANVLPDPNSKGFIAYQGNNQMMLDMLYTMGQLSQLISATHILAMKNQAMIQELMAGYGLPITIKELEISANNGQLGVLPFPGFPENAPTLQDLNALTNLNLSLLLGGKVDLTNLDEEDLEDA